MVLNQKKIDFQRTKKKKPNEPKILVNTSSISSQATFGNRRGYHCTYIGTKIYDV